MKRTIASLLKPEKGSTWDALSNYAPWLLFLFANLVILVSDVRVFDYLYTQTGSWWKALIGLLGCAVPFFLWEIAWNYNSTTEAWRKGSLVMAGLAFFTSILIGLADYIGWIGQVWAAWLLGLVVVEIGIHSVFGLLYYYNDPDVARVRRRAQANARMADQQINAQEAQQLLANGKAVLDVITQLEGQYDPADVAMVIGILTGSSTKEPRQKRGGKEPRPYIPSPMPVQANRGDGQRPGADEKAKEPVFTNRSR